MQIQTETASCVLVGILNKAIFRPEWLVKNAIVEGDSAAVDFMVFPGPAHFRYSLGGFTWTISSNSLIVATESGNGNPGDVMAKVFTTLRHTPVHGVGNNFQFLPDRDAGEKLHHLTRSKMSQELTKHCASGNLANTVFVAPHEGGRLNLTFEANGPSVVRILANYHRDAADADQACEAAKHWSKDHDHAEKLIAYIQSMIQ